MQQFMQAAMELNRALAAGSSDVAAAKSTELRGLFAVMVRRGEADTAAQLEALGLIATMLQEHSQLAMAVPWYEPLCALAELAEPDGLNTAWDFCYLAECLEAAGRASEAEAVLERARSIGRGRDGALATQISIVAAKVAKSSRPVAAVRPPAPSAALRTVSPVVITPTGGSLKWSFNHGALFVISINRQLPGATAVNRAVAAALDARDLGGRVVHEAFGSASPPSFEVETGAAVSVPVAHAVISACVAEVDRPMVLSMNRDDGRFAYTQRIYVGTIVPSRKPVTPRADIDALLAPGLAEPGFRDLLARLP